ncbi:hypothetical protein DK26_09695 [Bosea sp. WAO]|uniref:hypothetical protein n=1 Tax=Bosea sp. WAO TaxID=406341 RepID=UPI000748DDA4|nr:hypothetical protein [Bosea sp. WAO]KUL95416.1 hypothetical protein DK26_09695 [Bosea sp. WAO]
MSSRNMKLEDAKARAQVAFEKSEQRKRDASQVWQSIEDEALQVRLKTERLKALRLAKEAIEAEAKPKVPEPSEAKPVRRRRTS